MKTKNIIVCMLILLSLGLQGQSYWITGTVKSETQQPIAGWPVTLVSEPGVWPQVNEILMTNEFGAFSYTGQLSDSMLMLMTASTLDCNQNTIDTTVMVQSGQSHILAFVICDPTPCQASFEFTPEGDSNQIQTFRFYNTSTGPYTSVFWNFGDGTTSTDPSPVHTFQPGEWNVCLTISSNNPVCFDTACDVITVASLPCTNDFSYSSNGLVFDFSGWISGGMGAEFSWDFGDGTTGSGPQVNHTFNAAGSYLITLTTTDTDSCIAISSKWVLAVAPACNSAFIWFLDTLNPGLVHFTNQSTGDIISWQWDFGDGHFSQESSPQHLFGPGTWNVCLTVASVGGCTDTACTQINISDTLFCQAHYSWLPDPDNPLLLHFTDESSGDIGYRNWDFGDGSSINSLHPDHLYAEAGTYQVCMNVYSSDSSCYSVYCEDIEVGENLYFPVFGQVRAGFFPADSVYVELYRMTSGTPELIQTAYTGDFGAYSFYAVPKGDYFFKASLLPGSSLFGQYLPTYTGNTLFWAQAEVIEIEQPQGGLDIDLLPAPDITSGPGRISGTITLPSGLKKNMSSGIPDVTIYLLQATGEILLAQYSDEDGNFEFSGIPEGSYILKPEITGKPVTPYAFAINSQSFVIEGIVFTVNHNGIVYGDTEPLPEEIDDAGQPYPNPAGSTVFMDIVAITPVSVTVQLKDLQGRTYLLQTADLMQGHNRLEINLPSLIPGMYSLILIINNEKSINRKVILQ